MIQTVADYKKNRADRKKLREMLRDEWLEYQGAVGVGDFKEADRAFDAADRLADAVIRLDEERKEYRRAHPFTWWLTALRSRGPCRT